MAPFLFLLLLLFLACVEIKVQASLRKSLVDSHAAALRFFSFFMAFLSAFFLRRRASSSLIEETLLELEREGMVSSCTFGFGVAACAATPRWQLHARAAGW